MKQLLDMDEQEMRTYLQVISEMIEGVLPGGSGRGGRCLFAFMIYDKGMAQYTTNTEREGVIGMLRELADALEGGQTVDRVAFGGGVEPTPVIKMLCRRLNMYLAMDRVSLTAAMLVRSLVAPGSGFIDDPEIIVSTPANAVPAASGYDSADLTPFEYHIGFLGLLNGLHGCQTHDLAMVLDDQTNRLLEFRIVPRTKVS